VATHTALPEPARRAVGRFVRAVSAGVAFAAFGLAPLAPSRASAAEATETAVKAAYLFKLGFFVEWPSAAFPAADSPFTMCIVGSDPFDGILDDAVKGQKIGDHPVAVKRLTTISRDSGCRIVYFADGEPAQISNILAALRGSYVLTVTDGKTDSDESGIINFVIKDSRVRFVINDAAAADCGLSISSRLLNLALAVKPRH